MGYVDTVSNNTFTAGDIWSENGISLFAIIGYWIDGNWQMNERLLLADGFSTDAHSGEEIRERTLEGLHQRWGIAESPDMVPFRVHGSTPDEGANMLKAWQMFEGGACVCHRAQSALRNALKVDHRVVALVKKVKGIVAHFHRSNKVSHLGPIDP